MTEKPVISSTRREKYIPHDEPGIQSQVTVLEHDWDLPPLGSQRDAARALLDDFHSFNDFLHGDVPHGQQVLLAQPQSTPRIRLARQAAKEETFSVRIPLELNDVLWGVSYELGANPMKFNSALIRFYLHEAADDRAVARRLKKLSTASLAGLASKTKLTLRSDASLLARVKQIEEREGVSRSDLVRGAVLAAKEDVFDRPRKKRLAQLRAIAEAV